MIKDKYIDCERHIGGRIAFVCQHLIQEKYVGFYEAFETIESEPPLDPDDDYQAWCGKCEKSDKKKESGLKRQCSLPT